MYLIHSLGERKMAFRLGENETEIDSVLTGIQHRWFLHGVMTIPGQFEDRACRIRYGCNVNKECSEKDTYR